MTRAVIQIPTQLRKRVVRVRSVSDSSDAALVVSVGRWSEDALAELFRRHGGAVLSLARRVLSGDRASAEEVTQEVFLKLWQQPERFDPERGSLRSYLLTQAHTRAVDRLRSESARRRRETADAAGRAHEPVDDLERQVSDLAIAEHVRSAMAQLPDAERQAIVLAYFGGHTYREVAELLDQPEGTVKSRIRTGLRRLREALAAEGVGAGSWLER